MPKATAPKKTAVKPAAKKTTGKAKKIAPKKAAAADNNRINIKYTDKSPGQPHELVTIFESIKKMLLPYVKGDMKMHGGTGGQVSLVNHRPVEIEGRKKPEMWFAGALIQKGYVGFYFMPVYAEPSLTKQLHPDLAKCLKGKACFHIKKNDPALMEHVKDAIRKGYEGYKKKGWI